MIRLPLPLTRRPVVMHGWWSRTWLPAARDSLRRRRHMSGSRWWPLRVLLVRAIACRRPEPRPGVGYGWTCQRRHGHGGLHRFRNYVWSDRDQHAYFDPMPIHGHSVISW